MSQVNSLKELAQQLTESTDSPTSKSIKVICFEYVQGATTASLVQLELLECGSVYLIYLEPGASKGEYVTDYAIDYLVEDDYRNGNIRRLFANWLKDDSYELCHECNRVFQKNLKIINATGQESVYVYHEAFGTTYTILPI